MDTNQYNFPMHALNPKGKQNQVRYAKAAVNEGSTALGVVGAAYVLIGAQNTPDLIPYEKPCLHSVEEITDHIAMTFSGLAPDFRPLVNKARKLAQQYKSIYKEPIPISRLVNEIAKVMQEHTQSGGVRPFGVSLLIGGWHDGKGYLYECDPTGAFLPMKATVIGKNSELIEKLTDNCTEYPPPHSVIATWLQFFECDHYDVGQISENGCRRLPRKFDEIIRIKQI